MLSYIYGIFAPLEAKQQARMGSKIANLVQHPAGDNAMLPVMNEE